MRCIVALLGASFKIAASDVCGGSGSGYTLTALPTQSCSGDVESCPYFCCSADATLCSSVTASNYCGSGKYLDSEKMTNEKSTTNCCTDRATCATSGQTCPAGYVARTGSTNSMCPEDGNSCLSTCCEVDSTTCAGNWWAQAACTGNLYYDDSKATNTAGSTNSDYQSNCCSTKQTCGNWAGSCPAGYQMRSGVTTTNCPGDSETCDSTCCQADTTKCGGILANCPSTHYQDTEKNNDAAGSTSAERVANCCTLRATCQDYINEAASSGIRAKIGELVLLAFLVSWTSK